ncbi:MAG: DinB family protein [Anaerolineae bacterium]|nr:DinB family protein [Anaerolineae bacterium]
MITNDNLTWNYNRNMTIYAKVYLANLTHTQSLVQPPIEGNCVNWILGHIVAYRNYALKMCQLAPAVSDAIEQRYAKESAPVLADGSDAAQFEDLRQAYYDGHERLMAYVATMSAEQAAEILSVAGFTQARAEILTTFLRHESYHLGQLEWLHVWARQS